MNHDKTADTATEKPQKKKRLHGLRWSFCLCKKQYPLMLVITVLTVFSATLNVYFSVQTKTLIDAAQNRETDVFRYACIVLGVMLVAQIVSNSVNGYLTSMCQSRNIISMRQRMMNMIMLKRYETITTWHSGELLNRITSDSSVISDTITTLFPDIISCLVQLILAAGFLFIYDKWFTLILLGGGVLLYGFGRLISIKVKKFHKSAQEADGKARSYMQEVITSLLVIKVFNAFASVREKNKALHDRFYKIQMGRAAFSTFAGTCFSAVAFVAYAFALFWCGDKLLKGVITFGTLTAIQQLVNRVRVPLTALSGMFPRLANMEASAERLLEIEEVPDEECKEMPAAFLDANDRFAKIDVNDLTFAYDYSQIDDDPVISHMNLSIERGDFVALTGTSGIGKSTIFKLLLGVYGQYRGTLTLTMTSGSYPLGAETRGVFAYVPQGNFLFSGTIRENITFLHPDATEDEISEALRMSCADEFVSKLEEGLETLIGERGAGLSEGQVQRLAIARAVLSGAQVLLLDEATSALDEVTEAKLLQNLKQLKEKSCIIVTHRPAALAICNKRIELVKR